MKDMPENNDFLGKGMKFPPQINAATGRFVLSEGEQSVRESLYMILMTQISERPMRPDFGSNLMAYTFMDVTQANVSMVVRAIQEQIMQFEPRVTDVDIYADVSSRPGVILFDVGYTVRTTNVRDNFVFPFYMNNQASEEEERETEEYEPETVEEVEY